MRTRIALVVLALIPVSCGTAPILTRQEPTHSSPEPARANLEPTPIDTGTFALLAKVDRLAAYHIWPGFDPTAYPVAIFDGERTLLFRHPAPPAEFSPVPSRDGVWIYTGRHPSVVANTSTELAGIRTATLMPAGAQTTLDERVGLLIHELFHVFQRERHPGWRANEAELFTYPVDDAEHLMLRRLETEALRRALAAEYTLFARCWGRNALVLRRERFTLLPTGAVAYERGTELNEGLAAYIEHSVIGAPPHTILPAEDFAPEAVRTRGYRIGAALARLLDGRLFSAWRTTLEENDTTALDLMLAAAYDAAPDPPADSFDVMITPGGAITAAEYKARCTFTPIELERTRAIAMADIDSLRTRRAEARRTFVDRAGWTLVVDATETPLFPKGFDPLNVQVVAPGEVLHTRYVELGNESSVIEVIGRAALTEAASAHPLFNGVRSLTITGLEDEPAIETTEGVTTLTANGISATLRGATVAWSGRTVTVRLRR
jgi:hypothetical protein